MSEIAQQAMALPGFKWMPGMLPIVPGVGRYQSDRVFEPGSPPTVFMEEQEEQGRPWWPDELPAGSVPDLSDPATGGCLLELLGLPNTAYSWLEHVQVVTWPDGADSRVGARGATLAEACCHVAIALGRWPGGEG